MLEPYKRGDKLNIEAMLSCAFARSTKMMRFINGKYDADKEFYYKMGQTSSRKNSRFLTANRIKIKTNAYKALGVIMAAQADQALEKEMLRAAEKAFKPLAAVFDKNKGEMAITPVLMAGKVLEKGDDDCVHDTVAIYCYFCNMYGLEEDQTDPFYAQCMATVYEKEIAYLRPFNDITNEACADPEGAKRISELASAFVKALGGKSIAEISVVPKPESPEHGFLQTVWDIAQFDNLPISMYEKEEFSTHEVEEIFQAIAINIAKGNVDKNDVGKYYIAGLIMRGYARMYHELENVVERYAGIIRDTKEQRELQKELGVLRGKVEELRKLSDDKQDKLNEKQVYEDKLRKRNADLEAELLEAKEKMAILQDVANKEAEPEADDTERLEAIGRGSKLKAVVFGGPPNWHTELKKVAPKYNCIAIDNNTFDIRIIDRADAVIIKTDYLSHKQWRVVIDRAKKKNKKVVYCGNNIVKLLEQAGR